MDDITLYNNLTQRSESKNLSFELAADKNGYYVSGIGSCTDTEIIIPAKHSSKKVIGIKEGAFRGNPNITAVLIGENIKEIGANAFASASNLYTIIFSVSATVSHIGIDAFNNCPQITFVHIPNITMWCNIDFDNGYSNPLYFATRVYVNGNVGGEESYLTQLNIPEGVTKISKYAFYGYMKLESLKLSSSVKDIGYCAFCNCGNMSSIQINDSLEHVGEDAFSNTAFYNNSGNRTGANLYVYKSGKSGSCILIDCSPASTVQEIAVGSDCYLVAGGAFKHHASHLSSIKFNGNTKYINEDAFYACNLSSISFASSILEIGDRAFYSCNNLSSLSLPANLTHVGNSAFANCVNLKSINFGNNVRTLGSNVFLNDIRLATARIPASVTSIGEGLFRNCSSLISVEMSWQIKELPAYTYANCYKLGSINTTGGDTKVEYIGEHAFENCIGIYEIGLGDATKSIGEYAFQGCINLQTFDIGKGLEDIKPTAFSRCRSLYKFTVNADNQSFSTINDSLYSKDETTLYHYARAKVDGIYNSYSPRLTTIKAQAFSECVHLSEIHIPESVTNIEDGAFRSCYGLVNINVQESNPNYCSDKGSLYTKDKKHLIQYTSARDDSFFIMPSSVVSIGSGAFESYQHLLNIYYKGTTDAQWNSITISSGNDRLLSLPRYYHSDSYPGDALAPYRWKDIGGIPILWTNDMASPGLEFTSNGDNTCYVSGIGACTYKDIVIPDISPDYDRVTGIGAGAFQNCAEITSIKIPDDVTYIGSRAFMGCSKLTTIIIPNSGSLKNIGSQAFFNCSSLTKINIPESVIELGEQSFYRCTQLTEASISTKIKSVPYRQFYNCLKLSTLYCANDITYVADEAFYGCSALSTFNFSDSLESIGKYGFYNSGLSAIIFPEKITKIEDYSFANCSNLTTAVLQASTTRIGDYAFSGCSKLTSMIIPKAVTYLGVGAFENCTRMSSLSIGEVTSAGGEPICGITRLNAKVFSGCAALATLNIPNNITEIEEGVLSGCSALTNLSLPFIGQSASVAAGPEALFGYIFGKTSYASSYAASQVYNPSTSAYVTYYIPSSLKTVIIKGGSLRTGAFYQCSSITSITIPSNITSIEDQTFCSCNNLSSINIPSALTKIGHWAFAYCSKIPNMSLPASVTSIGNAAFYSCTSLKSINIPSGVSVIGSSAFYNCSALTAIEIPGTVTTIAENAFRGCSNITSVSIPESVTSMGGDAFNGCSRLSSVYVPINIPAGGNNTMFAGNASGRKFWAVNSASNDAYRSHAIWSTWRNDFYVNLTQSYIFNANGGSGSMSTLNIHGYGNLSPLGFSAPDTYYFVGWNTQPNGSGVSYSNGQQIYVISDEPITLYAQWDNQYTLTFFKTLDSWANTYCSSRGGAAANTGKQELYGCQISRDGGASFQTIPEDKYRGYFTNGTSWTQIGTYPVRSGDIIRVWVTYDDTYNSSTCNVFHNNDDGAIKNGTWVSYDFQVRGNTNIGYLWCCAGIGTNILWGWIKTGNSWWNCHIYGS